MCPLRRIPRHIRFVQLLSAPFQRPTQNPRLVLATPPLPVRRRRSPKSPRTTAPEVLPVLVACGDKRAQGSAKMLQANLSVLQGQPDLATAKEAMVAMLKRFPSEWGRVAMIFRF